MSPRWYISRRLARHSRSCRHQLTKLEPRLAPAGILSAITDGAGDLIIADAGGHLIALERMDGGRFHTVHSATTKAVCAASNKRPTSPQGAQGQPLDVAHALGLALAAGAERWTATEGGFPVIIDGECIGGLGVSGGDWATDERIAQAAVESIGARWRIDGK